MNAQPRAVIALHAEKRYSMRACSAAHELAGLWSQLSICRKRCGLSARTKEEEVAEADPQHSALADTGAAVENTAAAAVREVQAA